MNAHAEVVIRLLAREIAWAPAIPPPADRAELDLGADLGADLAADAAPSVS